MIQYNKDLILTHYQNHKLMRIKENNPKKSSCVTQMLDYRRKPSRTNINHIRRYYRPYWLQLGDKIKSRLEKDGDVLKVTYICNDHIKAYNYLEQVEDEIPMNVITNFFQIL